MSDDTADLDRLRARMAEESYQRDPDGHPTAETLAAYQADKLSSEENDAIQEHVASCSLCAERLLDLQRFLEFAPEERSRGDIVDLETAAEWRKLHERMETERKLPVSRKLPVGSFFSSPWAGYSAAAALLAVAAVLGLWNLSLVRKSRQPMVVQTERTVIARESFRGGAAPIENEPPISLPALITLNLPTDTPESLYRVDLIPAGSRRAERSFEIAPDGSELRFLLPAQALPPGRYTVRVYGFRHGRRSSQAWTYELTIGPSEP